MSDEDDYKVGYKKPPKHTRFGQPDGNPTNTKGRPAGRTIAEYGRLPQSVLWECFIQTAQHPINITEDGQRMTVPFIFGLVKMMGKDALNGDRHARREFFKYFEKSTYEKDQEAYELQRIWANFTERKLKAKQKLGSLFCYETYYDWFMFKKKMRVIETPEQWPYEVEEPKDDDDWIVFLENYDYLKKNRPEPFNGHLCIPARSKKSVSRT